MILDELHYKHKQAMARRLFYITFSVAMDSIKSLSTNVVCLMKSKTCEVYKGPDLALFSYDEVGKARPVLDKVLIYGWSFQVTFRHSTAKQSQADKFILTIFFKLKRRSPSASSKGLTNKLNIALTIKYSKQHRLFDVHHLLQRYFLDRLMYSTRTSRFMYHEEEGFGSLKKYTFMIVY